ncbi:MAG: FKBP-type peptidyl-prolyl cis-trans isomerase [Chitinophagaceae bacterium]
MKKVLISSVAVIVMFVSCLKSTDYQQNCIADYDPCALKAPSVEIDTVLNYLAAHKDSIYNFGDTIRHCSGMYYIIDSVGTGATPQICSYVDFKYKGMLTNGTVFQDQTTTAINAQVSNLIAGFKNALPAIKVGGGLHLFIPPTLGYGSAQSGTIPPNSMLIFQVTLTGVE